ncbi:hypothetical protein GKODMF_12480 [Candidatus Electrothrix gigas]
MQTNIETRMVMIPQGAKEAKQTKSPVEILLKLSGSWEDSKDTDEIIADLWRSRRNISERKIIQKHGQRP